MLATAALGLLGTVVILAFRGRHARVGLACAMALVTVFLAVRYDFGPDYFTYYDAFMGDNLVWLGFEPGWLLLTGVFQPLGFFALVAVLAGLNGLAFYRHIARYTPEGLFWLSFFVYVLHPEMLLTHASAMRQAVAMLIFIAALPLLESRRYLVFCLCVVIGASFHASAVVLLGVPLFHRLAFTSKRLAIGVAVAAYCTLLLAAPAIRLMINTMAEAYLPRWTEVQDPGLVASGLGIALSTLMFAATLIALHRAQGERDSTLLSVAVVGFLVVPLTVILDLASRIGMYFGPAMIAVLPGLPMLTRSRAFALAGWTLLVAFTIWRFFSFFDPSTWSAYFMQYRTVFGVS